MDYFSYSAGRGGLFLEYNSGCTSHAATGAYPASTPYFVYSILAKAE